MNVGNIAEKVGCMAFLAFMAAGTLLCPVLLYETNKARANSKLFDLDGDGKTVEAMITADKQLRISPRLNHIDGVSVDNLDYNPSNARLMTQDEQHFYDFTLQSQPKVYRKV